MNEQAKEVLAQMMQRALDGVDAAAEFSQQQIPEVIEQLLAWKLFYHSIDLTIAVALMVLGYFIVKKLVIPTAKKEIAKDGDCLGTSIATAIGGMFYFMVTCVFLSEGLTALQIWLAPKVYLLEYGAELIK